MPRGVLWISSTDSHSRLARPSHTHAVRVKPHGQGSVALEAGLAQAVRLRHRPDILDQVNELREYAQAGALFK